MRITRTIFATAVMALVLFHVTVAQVPTITSISPETGKMGRTITITGTGFSGTPASNKVYFGSVSAPVITSSSTKITVNVPAQATYDPVSVTVGGLTGYSPKPFRLQFNFTDSISASSLTSSGGPVLATLAGPQASALTDLDGDGRPELVVITFQTNKLRVFQNTSIPGNMSFDLGAIVDLATATSPSEISIADIDGDGLPDIVTSNFVVAESLGTYSVFRNSRIVQGQIAFDTRIDSTVGHTPTGVATADLDLDGRPDIIVVNQADANISIARNTSAVATVSFDLPITKAVGGIPHSVTTADLDGDGKPEVLVTDIDGRTVHIFKNTSPSPGTITVEETGSGLGSELSTKLAMIFVTAGDLDLDGKPDVIAADTVSTVTIWRNTSTGAGDFSFAPAVQLLRRTGVGDTLMNVGAVTLGDINGDGKPDIAVANAAENSVSVWQNKSTSGNLAFGSKIEIVNLDTYPIRPVLGDVDGDAHPDLISPGFNSSNVTIRFNAMADGYVRANLKAILQGPFSAVADSMSRTLNSGGYLSGHFTSASVPALAVDSVFVELRDSSSASKATIRRTAPAWLTTNGSVRNYIDTSKTYVEFDTISPGPYYVVVRHRNHIGVMSSAPVNLTATGTFYDYTTGQAQAFGANSMIHVGSRYCLYAGDGNVDGQVTTLDFTPWLAAARAALTGYRSTDFNCDGQNTSQDFTLWLANARSAAASHIP